LYDCLLGIYEGKAEPSILDKYSEIRRKKYQELTDPISQSNIRRLFDQDPDKALENDDFLKMLKQDEGNVEAQQKFLRSPNGLKYDFTQHYNQPNGCAMEKGKDASVRAQHVPDVGAV
jgi:hypothetical protein